MEINTGFIAARSTASIREAEKLIRVDLREPFVQERAARYELVMWTVTGTEKIADIPAKNVSCGDLDQHLQAAGFFRILGRHTLC